MRTWLEYGANGTLGPARELDDREVLLEEGHTASAVYFLATGCAEIFHTSADGFSVVVKLVTAPTILSSPELLVREPVYLASIRAAGPATVHHLTRERFLEILREPGANLEAMIDIGLAFTGAARFEPSRLCSTETLLAMLLVAYADVFGEADGEHINVTLRRSQADLAEAVGSAERSVNRILTQWKKQGLLTKKQGHYIIHGYDHLRVLAGEFAGCLVHRWRDVL